jgi:hypothetical protein
MLSRPLVPFLVSGIAILASENLRNLDSRARVREEFVFKSRMIAQKYWKEKKGIT